ncbi:MAG: 4-(cytidine 5'-diphospho)-2-C-methyl-D-erythritol kinase [Clostridia bacterium]|nr:4-(cytidine 5'-diphospho)-2-C-methyl-D-erythritol kinase [Clostridia bacterium]MBP3293373.1 4-(cytidine 5'-diphospho)-2-C-methyl-D-erythritol kinase [Clostridia bacterium]
MILTKTIKSYAKINLYLNVGAKRPDGYHDLESVMQQVSLFDYVTVLRDTDTTQRGVRITCTDRLVPSDDRNIAAKCAMAFLDKYNIDSEVSVSIDKRIPVAAGLGGGSTDGAAVLSIMNSIFDVNAPMDELCALGAKLGADIPFCLVGGTCTASGIGEILTPVKTPVLPYHILICNAGHGVSTPEAYRKLDETAKDEPACAMDDVLRAVESGEMPERLYNSFERVILPEHAEAAQIRQTMLVCGADVALMSGSGPSVFGLFRNEDARDKAKDFFDMKGILAMPCEPVVKNIK